MPRQPSASNRVREPVICYPPEQVPDARLTSLLAVREQLELIGGVRVPPRDGRCIEVPRGHFFRVRAVEGPQVGDLNLWASDNLAERFYSGKTRQLHASHVTTGARLWSHLPYLRPLATITHDTLVDYGVDEDGGRVHDVIGTRCDPYTARLLGGGDYGRCCHSNLVRALAGARGIAYAEAEPHVHDVLNVFMCTGFTRDEGRYFMKASPVRPGDYLECFAEIDLLVGLSACPGGDCGRTHSSDEAACYPLEIDVLRPPSDALRERLPPAPSDYAGGHRI